MIDSNNPTETWNILQKDQYVENLNVPQGRSKEGHIRVVCISDTHMKHEKLQIPDGDILVHTGDFSSLGRWDDIKRFVDWFASQPHQHKIVFLEITISLWNFHIMILLWDDFTEVFVSPQSKLLNIYQHILVFIICWMKVWNVKDFMSMVRLGSLIFIIGHLIFNEENSVWKNGKRFLKELIFC